MTRRERRETLRQAVGVSVVLVVVLGIAASGGHGFAEDATEKELKVLGSLPGPGTAEVVVSSDGLRLAFVAPRDAGQTVVCDGKEGRVFDEAKDLTWSGDGNVLAYAARKNNLWYVVVGSDVGLGYAKVLGPVLSCSGSRVACFVSDGGRLGTVLVNGLPLKNQMAIGDAPPVISASGERVAFAASLDSGTYDSAVPTGTVGSRPGVWGYSAGSAQRSFIACNQSRSRLYDDVRRPIFSPDGEHLAYVARLQGTRYLVCDGKWVFGPIEDLSNPVWSPDSGTFAFTAKERGNWFLVCGKSHQGPFTKVGPIAFSAGASHLAFAAQNADGLVVVCDGKKSPPCQEVSWIGFSFDGRHLVYEVRKGGQWMMVMDGVEGPGHARLIVPARAGASKSGLRYVVVDGADVRLVEWKWPAGTDWSAGLK